MNNQIEAAVSGLVRSIKDSEEYHRYRRMCEKVHAYPELERQIHEFRRKNYELQNEEGSWDRYERIESLEREYATFRRDPMVREYLEAELSVCRVIQHVNWEIVRNIDFELGI